MCMRAEILRPYFLLILLALLFVTTAYIIQPFFGPLVLATIAAVVLQPLYAWVLRYIPGRAMAALATVVLTSVCIVLPLFFLGSQIFNEARSLSTSFTGTNGHTYVSTTIDNIGLLVDRVIPGAGGVFDTLGGDLDQYARMAVSYLATHLGSVATSIAAFFLSLLIFFISFYYMLKDGPQFKKAIIALSPLSDTDDEFVFTRLGSAINSIIKGSFTIGLIQGTLTGFGFFLFGIPNFVLWGMVATFASFIPGVGTSLVLVPGIAFLLFTGDTTVALGLALWSILAVGLVDNFLGPRLMSRGTEVHPLLVLVGVLGGLALFGPLGIFLGPLTLSFLFVLLGILERPPKTQKAK